ncbi:two-component system regulatory protein YycI [Virgibacillus sp. W0430]|uniref:two-component system regulatory protein YycI n=1 Tax=Virgibacillus sp. W0430 TaxID=3391580 RepID=UPI003F44F9CB
MQWGQIKTLFILCFLILDIYLLIQFLDKQEQADLGILEQQDTTIEEQLEEESIEVGPLPNEEYEEAFISVKPKVFTEAEAKQLKELKGQNGQVLFKNFIFSQYEKPKKIPENAPADEIEKQIQETLLFPEKYTYWDWNKTANVLIFFQEEGSRPIYFNQNGLILVYLNTNNEAIFYTQTMLGESETRAEKQKLITPIKAIETLYKLNELSSGDKVTKVDIGFHTRIPLDSGIQVFAPTWKVVVNDTKDYFVNAMEGFVFSSDEDTFLYDAINMNLDKVQALDDQDMSKIFVEQQINGKLELLNRGETE